MTRPANAPTPEPAELALHQAFNQTLPHLAAGLTRLRRGGQTGEQILAHLKAHFVSGYVMGLVETELEYRAAYGDPPLPEDPPPAGDTDGSA